MTIRRLSAMLLWFSAYSAAQNPPPSLTTIYNFTGGSDGSGPTPLTVGEGGVLYGATASGGGYGYGTIYSLTPPALPGGSWTHSVLYSFQGGSDGEEPGTRLTIGSGGVLYGTTGNCYSACVAVVYSLTPPSSPGAQWTFAVLASFGTEAASSVSISPGGVLYGTAPCSDLCGTVFALLPPASPGGSWTERTVKNVGTGSVPAVGLAIGAGLALYGINTGFITIPAEVFELAPPATPGGAWTETVLYQFVGIVYGATDLAIGGGGVLYGTVSSNGGAVYSLTPPASTGGAWTQATLIEFPTNGILLNGVVPGPVTVGENGTVYGTTQSGGDWEAGTAYALKPPASPGGAWTEIGLHTFTGSDGKSPTGLAIGAGGVLYGTAVTGGAYRGSPCAGGCGTVFALAE
ncbi:MAG TPA: choice-of-anchor tandem repeat GloVer-containing protein [Bryobacteraceae bacterium]|nr:choice-of-anchor tandem repeat GloVer-containing protein [Bryobacteraceae bacterium]